MQGHRFTACLRGSTYIVNRSLSAHGDILPLPTWRLLSFKMMPHKKNAGSLDETAGVLKGQPLLSSRGLRTESPAFHASAKRCWLSSSFVETLDQNLQLYLSPPVSSSPLRDTSSLTCVGMSRQRKITTNLRGRNWKKNKNKWLLLRQN